MEVGYGKLFLISVKRSGSWSDVHQMSTGADKNNEKNDVNNEKNVLIKKEM